MRAVHYARDDVDIFPLRFGGDAFGQLLCSRLDASRWGDGRNNNLYTFMGECIGDASPVLNSWKVATPYFQFVKA